MRSSDRSVGSPRSHPRVEHLRSRHVHRVRYHSFFSNSDSLVSEDSQSEEDVAQPSCLIVLMTFFIVVLVVIGLTISGTLIFVMIGKHEERADELPECLEQARKWADAHWNTTRTGKDVQKLVHATLRVAQKCDQDNKMILTPSDAAVYSWSLYSTVGYGDMFMHSGTGRIVTIFYAFFSSALYLAVKAECGTIIARHLSDFIHFFRMALRRVRCGKFTPRDPHPHPLRPIVRFFICLGLLFGMMLVLAVYMKVVEGDAWTWGTAVYFSYITMAVIGLGDVVPDKKVPFIVFAQPLLLVGDTLFAQVNWYMQDRLRFGLHSLLRLCQCERKANSRKATIPDAEQHYPSVTSKMLPMVPSASVTTLNAKNNNKKMTKKERKQFKARRKDTNYSLRQIPNETVFGPDRKQPVTATTQQSLTKSTVSAPTQSTSSEPVKEVKADGGGVGGSREKEALL